MRQLRSWADASTSTSRLAAINVSNTGDKVYEQNGWSHDVGGGVINQRLWVKVVYMSYLYLSIFSNFIFAGRSRQCPPPKQYSVVQYGDPMVADSEPLIVG